MLQPGPAWQRSAHSAELSLARFQRNSRFWAVGQACKRLGVSASAD